MDRLTNKVMENAKNTDSLWGGLWFYFSDGDRSIIIHGANFSGRETIFIDGTKVSQKHSWRIATEHVFNYQGDSFEVMFKTLNILKGLLKVDVVKNGLLLDSETRDTVESVMGYTSSGKKKNSWLVMLVSTLCCFLTGFGIATVARLLLW